MTNEVQRQQDKTLRDDLAKVRWPIEYGTVEVQLKDGKIVLATIRRTVKLD